MRKLLLSLMAFALVSVTMSAQSVVNANVLKAHKSVLQKNQKVAPSTVKRAPAKVALQDNQIIMGNYTSDSYAPSMEALGLPTFPGDLRVATVIPCAKGSKYDGSTVKSIRFAISNPSKVTSVFMIEVMEDGKIGKEVVTQAVENSVVGWNTVELTTPYTINAEGLMGYFVGYDYVQSDANDGMYYDYECYPLSLVLEGSQTMPTYVYADLEGDGAGWYDLGAQEFGNFSVQCIIEKEGGFPEYDLSVGNIAVSSLAKQGSNFDISASIYNQGTKVPTSYTIGVALDDKEMKEISSSELKVTDGSANLETSITIPEDAAIAAHTISVYVKTINGVEPTECTNDDKATAPVKVVAEIFSRKVVVEEATGTWCGFCVRGIAGIEKMYKEYPDNFIAIAIHDDTEMGGAENYDAILNKISGYPGCIVNRLDKYITDPNEWDLRYIIDMEKELGIAKIEAKANWTDDTKTSVKVSTTSRFAYSDDNANVKIAYVVTENGVGPYAQKNYYAGGGYGELDGWENKGEKVPVIYDDVARGIYDFNGVTGSVPAAINTKDDYNYEYTVTLPSNVSNADNVNIITLLIDNETGEILNADMVKPGAPTGINAVNNGNATESARYNAAGQMITAPQKGINIIKMSNGVTRKVIVK